LGGGRRGAPASIVRRFLGPGSDALNLNLGQLVFVNTSASLLSSVIPVPGGIGAAEASLSAGLIALGVGESTALAVTVTQRLCTFYLPPIWNYLSLRWLERRGYV